MFSGITRTFKVVCITLVTVIFLAFAISNREVVNLSLFPLPYAADLPIFLLAILCFALGIIVGGLTVHIKSSKTRREAKAEHKRIEALENEISAIHSERPTYPAIANKL